MKQACFYVFQWQQILPSLMSFTVPGRKEMMGSEHKDISTDPI